MFVVYSAVGITGFPCLQPVELSNNLYLIVIPFVGKSFSLLTMRVNR